MMKNKILLLWIGCLIVLSGIQGCTDWLDVRPADRVTDKQVFNSREGLYSALYGLYGELLEPELYGQALTFEFIEILAQRYAVKDLNTYYGEVMNYKYTSDYPKGRLQNIWNTAYKMILNCNVILENAEHTSVLPEKDYQLITGEVLALRAYLHFDMLRLFGPLYLSDSTALSIPYQETVSYSASELLPAHAVVNDKVMADLDRAEELLLASDPVLTEGPMAFYPEDQTYAARVLRMNYYAVLALKARVSLYAGHKAEALKQALKIIDDPKREEFFPFITHEKIKGDARNPDRVFSTELLFSLYNPDRSSVYTNFFNPEVAYTNLLSVRPNGMEQVFAGEENDIRFYPIWKNSTLQGDNNRICVKFQQTENKDLFCNNLMPLIRLGEMYLIAAECAENEVQAYEYLNVLRNSRELGEISNNLAARLKTEYIREFPGEGQLFFYYKRKNERFLNNGNTGNGVMMKPERYVPALPDSEQKYRE